MVESLIERLRAYPRDKNGNFDILAYTLDGNEAADRIEALERKVKELREQSDRFCDKYLAALRRAEAAEATIARLSEALRPFGDFANALNEDVPDNVSIGIYAGGAMRFGPNRVANVGSLRNARAALSGANSGWRTMDSAPKDGEPVLLEYLASDGNLYYCVSRWIGTHWRGYPAADFKQWSRPFPAAPQPTGGE